jgi:hypothetical protein
VNCLQASTGKPLPKAHEDFLLSLEFFSLAAVFYWLAVLVGCIEKQEDIPKQMLKNLEIMETLSFALGQSKRETRQEKHERLRKQEDRKRKEKQKKQRKPKRFRSISLFGPSWCILPHHILKGFEFWMAILKGDTFLTKRKSLLDEMERMKTSTAHTEPFRNEYLVKAQNLISFLYQNQKLRWIFKRFFTTSRIQRFTTLNETDPITLEPITQPIQFPSFPQRKYYAFEAKPFAKHLHNKLIHNDGHIPSPLFPKNPFTNELFTLAQIISLIEQARNYGHTSWAIESFIACRYNLASYSIISFKPLRLHALRTTMSKVNDWDSIDTLYDFIKIQHTIHDEAFSIPLYTWAVRHAPHESRIVSWRKMCLKWYEADILMDDIDSKRALFTILEGRTLSLCSWPEELFALKKNKAKSTKQSDGSRSSQHTDDSG